MPQNVLLFQKEGLGCPSRIVKLNSKTWRMFQVFRDYEKTNKHMNVLIIAQVRKCENSFGWL
jgi:hypothetical protein